MSKLSSLFRMAAFHGKDMLHKIKENPERLLLGAMDKAGTGIWNSVLGTNWESPSNLYGGPTSTQFKRAEAQGIDTGPAKTADKIGRVVGSLYTGGALAGHLGAASEPAAAGVNSGGAGGSGTYEGVLGGSNMGYGQPAAAAPSADWQQWLRQSSGGGDQQQSYTPAPMRLREDPFAAQKREEEARRLRYQQLLATAARTPTNRGIVQ